MAIEQAVGSRRTNEWHTVTLAKLTITDVSDITKPGLRKGFVMPVYLLLASIGRKELRSRSSNALPAYGRRVEVYPACIVRLHAFMLLAVRTGHNPSNQETFNFE
jgi:hypothetical protein